MQKFPFPFESLSKFSFFSLTQIRIFQAGEFLKFLLFSLILFLGISSELYATPLIELKGEKNLNALSNLEYSLRFPEEVDAKHLLNSQPQDWKKHDNDEFFYYLTPGKYFWMRFDLVNHFSEQLYFIKIREFLLDSVDCFIILPNGDIKYFYAGERKKLSEKNIYSVNSLFPIYLNANDKAQVYIKIKSELISTSIISIQSTSGLLDSVTQEHFFLGGYYGFLLFMMILSIAVFFYLKDYAYLYYFIFLAFYGLFQFSRNSLAVYFFYPDYPDMNVHIWYTFLILSLSAGAVFSILFLNLKRYSPFIYNILFHSSYFILIFIPLPYIISENVIYIVPFVVAIYILMIYPASIFVHFKGFEPAKYFIAGWGFMILGILVSLFGSRVWQSAEYGSQVGSTLEVIFLAFAMLSKANRLQTEKDFIQEVAKDYKKELDLAGEIQQSLMPKNPPKIKGFDVHSFFLPMKGIGGDFFDFHSKNDHSFSCIMADVSGHGPAAALIASMVKLSFTETFGLYDRPEKALRKMNLSLLGNLGKKFVTAMYAHLNYRNKSLIYSSAGHPPIIIHRRKTDEIMQLDSKGHFLGWFAEIKLKEHSYQLQEGDRVLIYTDGLIEAFNSKQEMFDYDRLEIALRSHENMSAREFTYYLIYRIKEWVGFNKEFDDDITFMIIDVT